MPTANWLTPQPASYQEEPEPRGLLGFLGGGPDMGADIGDRLGVISQILMNAGSGRGGAGIAEATAAANERSTARRENRRAERMVARAADKIEPSNPEMAAVMRANTKFGMQMLGKQYESEWDNTSRLAQLKEEYRLKAENEAAKSAADLQQKQLFARMIGLGDMIPSNVATGPATQANQRPTGGDIQTSSIEQPVPAPVTPEQQQAPQQSQGQDEYAIGLPANPAQAERLYSLRKQWDDPDMPVEDMFALAKASMNDDNVGFDAIRKASNIRKETRKRATDFAARSNEIARQGPASLPGGISMLQPGQPDLLQAGIDPATVPPQQQPQTAELLRQAYKTSDESYTGALKSLMPSDSAGLTITTQNPDGTSTTVTTGRGGATEGKPTEANLKNVAFYNRGKLSMPELLKPENVAALRDYTLEAASKVPLVGNALTKGPYQTADSAAENFLISILRPDTGATINPDEAALYRRIFIPQPGDDDTRVAFKSALRHAALEGVRKGQTKEDIRDTAADAWRQLDPAAPGAQPPPLPDWAAKEGVSPEAWAAHPELWFDKDTEAAKK